MACYRQAAMDRTTLEAFTQVLVQEDLRAFQVAMAIISETKREPGETAFPDLGYILAVMREAEERWNRSESDPPPDRSPVYDTAQPLSGDRLRLAWKAEIEALRKQVYNQNPGVEFSEIVDYLPEPQRSRYTDLTTWAADWRTYPLKNALPRPRTYAQDKALPRPLDDAGGVDRGGRRP
jgi:hypothetical protein